MKLKNLGVALFSILTLAACEDEIPGTLQVQNEIQMKDRNGRQVNIVPGNYASELAAVSKKEVNLKVRVSERTDKTFKFKVPKGTLEQDQFNVPAATSGQPYDAIGARTVDVQRTSPVSTVESCTYYETEYRCHWESVPERCTVRTVCDANNVCRERETCTGGGERQVCGNEQVPYSGRQDVEYYDSYTTERLVLDLNWPGSETLMAQFQGARTDSDRHYTHRGTCR